MKVRPLYETTARVQVRSDGALEQDGKVRIVEQYPGGKTGRLW
jgi:hypothetical protein